MNKTKIFSTLLLLVLSFDVIGCSKVRFKDKRNEVKFTDTDDLPYKSEYQLEFKNEINFEDLEDYDDDEEKLFVDYEAKAKFEKEISDKLVYLGVNEFKLPEALKYEDGIFGGLYVSKLKVSVNSYRKYLDDLLKDFKKDTDIFGQEIYYKEFGQMKYSINFTFEKDGFSINFSPTNNLWDLDIMHDPLKQKPFIDNIYTGENYCLNVHYGDNDYKIYCIDGEFIEFKPNDGSYNDGHYIAYRDGLYYQCRIYENDILSEDDLYGPYAKSYAYQADQLNECVKATHVYYPMQYTNICKDVSGGINLGLIVLTQYTDKKFSIYDNHELLGYELCDGYYCAVLSNVGKVGRFSSGWEYKMYVDTKTGYIIKLDRKVGKNFETEFSCNIEYNDYSLHFEDLDGKTKISVEENIIPQKDCTVKFLDFDGNVISTSTVKSRKGVLPPSIPKKKDKLFLGWDYEVGDIKDSVTISPICDNLKKCTVKFYDFDGKEISSQAIDKYQGATSPKKNPYKKGYTFEGWDKNYYIVQDDLEVHPVFAPIITHEVIFKDWDGDVLKEEKVIDGKDATPPKREPHRRDYVFVGWSQEYENVTRDLEIFAMYSPKNSKVTFGSVTYYYNNLVLEANNKKGEEKVDFIFDKINDLGTASACDEYTESMLNEGKAITQAFPCSEAWSNFGVMLVNAGYLENAAEYFENAINYDPENEVYLINLAQLIFAHEKNEGNSFTRTLELINKALAINSSYGLAYQLRSSVYLKQGKESDALEDLVYSARWIWNDVSIAHFNSLYDTLDEKFDEAIKNAIYEEEDVKVNFSNPIGKYIDNLKEAAVLERGWSEGMSDTFNFPINVPSSAYHNNVSSFQTYISTLEQYQKKAEQSVNYYVVNRYLNDDDGMDSEGYYMVDSRAFTISRLINQYYKQKIEIATLRKLQYAQGLHDYYLKSQEVDVPTQELTKDEEFQAIKALANKFRLPDGSIDTQAMTRYMLDNEYEAMRTYFTKQAHDMEMKGVYDKQAYDKFLKDLLEQYYYDMTYFAYANMNEDVQDYFYSLIYLTTSDVIIEEYGEALASGMEALMCYEIIEICKSTWGIHDTNEDDIKQEEARQENIKAMKERVNQPTSYSGPDLTLGFSAGIGDISLNVSYSLITGDGEFGVDTPLISKSHKYERTTGIRTTTTLFYGTKYANEQIASSTVVGLADNVIPSFSDIHPFKTDSRVGVGNQVSIDRSGKILENAQIVYASRSFSAGDISISEGFTYKYDSTLSAYSYDSAQASLGYKNISTTMSF